MYGWVGEPVRFPGALESALLVSGFSLVKALKSVTISPAYNALGFTEGCVCITASVLTHGSERFVGLNRNNHSETSLSTCHLLDFS